MKRRKKIISVIAAIALLGLVFAGYMSQGFAAGGYRILQWAALNQYTNFSRLLLAIGAPPSPYKEIYDWDYFSEISDTPLHSTAKTGDAVLARSLIEHGAIDWCCCSCVTPLHDGIIYKHPEVVDLLLKAGADTEIPYDLSASVIELARTRGTQEIVAMILSHNQRLNVENASKRRVP